MIRLCLNSIVKNESNNLPRMLSSVRPWISSYAVLDTGSTDNTPGVVKDLLSGVPGIVGHAPFKDFSQARNEALKLARGSQDWDYLLLVDADMELMVENPLWLTSEWVDEAFEVIQRGGSLSYRNVRLVARWSKAQYRGVTHEYFDASAAALDDIWFVDHATGSNRGEKQPRDIRLLEEDLKKNPDNGRSWFYLAQSYKEAGRPEAAISAYQKRIALGGWDEEIAYSWRMLAKSHLDNKSEPQFVHTALLAFNERPTRAEPLYDLARFFRERSKNNLACFFAGAGRGIPYPSDRLFVDDFIYNYGFQEEFSIAGFYHQPTKPLAFRVCDELVLTRGVPAHTRELARTNLFHYLQPLTSLAPSFQAKRIELEFPEPYVAMNPSIVEWNGALVANVRTVNYRINDEGRYVYPDGDPFIRTRNWICDVSDDLTVTNAVELLWDAPVQHGEVIGLEDVRLWPREPDWSFTEEVWGSATVLQLHPGHPRQMVKFKLDTHYIAPPVYAYKAVELEELSAPNGIEKNWMPILGRPGEFVYGMGRVWRNGEIHIAGGDGPRYSSDDFRGGGQCVPFDDGYLAIIHEAMNHQHYAQRMYAHRFVWLDNAFNLSKVSRPFVFFDRQIEFAAGLVVQSSRVLVSFGVRDREAWIGSIGRDQVQEMLS